jgi:hypothetical protein
MEYCAITSLPGREKFSANVGIAGVIVSTAYSSPAGLGLDHLAGERVVLGPTAGANSTCEDRRCRFPAAQTIAISQVCGHRCRGVSQSLSR